MSKRTKSRKSLKPYLSFPLTAHTHTGRWCKRLKTPGSNKTRTFYFGPLADWQKAKERFDREWPFIVQGLTPPVTSDDASGACTLRTLANQFLESKRNKMAAGELTERSYRDYFRTCKLLIDHFGKDRRVDDLRPTDFEAFRAKLAERLSVVSLLNEITRCRVVLKYASDTRLIAQPIHFGQSFQRPSKRALRRVRNKAGAKMFTRDEVLTILDALDGRPLAIDGAEVQLKADPALRAMVLLGINGGLGNTDCANLPESAVDLVGGWLDYPRPKTEVQRRIPLWPETVDAIKAALAVRRRPRDEADAGLVFLTRQRRRYVRMTKADKPEKVLPMDAISKAFGKLLKKLHINGRHGLGFYTLRRQFEIIGGESRDQVTVDAIMGHTADSGDMGAIYRQGVVSDARLRAVVDTVRTWLWPADEMAVGA